MSILQLHKISLADKKVSNVGNMQLKHMPYIFIVILATGTASLRYYLLPEWGISIHLWMFVGQLGTLFAFWHFIKFINSQLNKYYPFERGVLKRMALQNIITLVVVGSVDLALTYLLQDKMSQLVDMRLLDNKPFMGLMVVVFFIVVFMFNFAFYAYHFFESWQETVVEKAEVEVQAADLEKEKSQVLYHQLKNQVNPHYLFNTLTSLDALIHTDPDLASEFVQHMAKVYRYVLQHKESEVVRMYEEVEFISHYVKLLKIRYAEGLNIHLHISDDAQDCGVVMVTLQMLIDNAIKHNTVQKETPLDITIKDQQGYLVVHNNKQQRKQIQTSNGTGLLQLQDLYGFLTEKRIIIDDADDDYTIKIPLL